MDDFLLFWGKKWINQFVVRAVGKSTPTPPALRAPSPNPADLEREGDGWGKASYIATRGGMGLFLADCHLEYARLRLAAERSNVETSKRSNVDEAREHLKTAKEMIAMMGYHRRDNEVEKLEEQIK